MMQGLTVRGPMMCDVNVDDAPGHKLTCLYVMLSRGTSLSRLRLIRPFHHRHLHRSRDPEIAKEYERLQTLANATLTRFYANNPEMTYTPPPRVMSFHEIADKATTLKCAHGVACKSCVESSRKRHQASTYAANPTTVFTATRPKVNRATTATGNTQLTGLSTYVCEPLTESKQTAQRVPRKRKSVNSDPLPKLNVDAGRKRKRSTSTTSKAKTNTAGVTTVRIQFVLF